MSMIRSYCNGRLHQIYPQHAYVIRAIAEELGILGKDQAYAFHVQGNDGKWYDMSLILLEMVNKIKRLEGKIP